ncbi:MAG: glycerol-3-phosphate acyltransferase [Thermoleophilia bacterium]|nr:glycerol-3-phosphate acyltransferase [Thermoleophilia bacterium]
MNVFAIGVLTFIAFILGSLPFAVWVGRRLSGQDVRAVADGNPGTANAFRAGGWRTGFPVLVLEVGKAGVPVGLANLAFGTSLWRVLPIAFAPILGHAFSPFLRFKGGKAIAATFGSWIGLTGFFYPLVLGLGMGVAYGAKLVDALAVLVGVLLFGLFLLFAGAPLALFVFWAGTLVLLAWTHRRELLQVVEVRRLRAARR